MWVHNEQIGGWNEELCNLICSLSVSSTQSTFPKVVFPNDSVFDIKA